MSISSSNWFKYLKEVRHGTDLGPAPEMIAEGLRDIGLPEYVIDRIESALPNAPEKAKTLLGNLWKNSSIGPGASALRGAPSAAVTAAQEAAQFQLVEALADEYGSYLAAPDLDPEKKKKITLILSNLKNVVSKPYGAWRKAFMKAQKALSKVGVPSEKVEHTKETLQEFLEAHWAKWWRIYDEIGTFLNDDSANYKLAEDAREDDTGKIDIYELLQLAQGYLENKEDPEQILHTFDDGSYWYNLGTSDCPIEADRMGHCGADSRGVLVSLRKKKGKRRESSSYVTMTWNDHEEILYQIKGRSNDAPPSETWPHIRWFIDEMEIKRVEETGEHSNDEEGFVEMNQYLASHTYAKFADDIEEKIQEIEREVGQIESRFRDARNELDVTDVGCSVESGEEHGGDPRSVFLYMTCDAEFEMDLGWPGFYEENGFYRATDGPDSERPLDYAEIPTNSWGSEASEFVGEIEIDDLAHELPGEDPETEWRIMMMEGASEKITAHLVVRLTNRHVEHVSDGDGAEEYDHYIDRVLEFDSDYQSYREKIRRGLVARGSIAKSPFDHAEQEMNEMELEHFVTYDDDSGIEFWFKPDISDVMAEGNLVYSEQKIPLFVPQYLLGLNNSYGYEQTSILYNRMFGPGPRRKTGEHLNKAMAARLQLAYKEKNAQAAKDQLSFDFGHDYTASEAALVLAEDSRFIIEPQDKGNYHQLGFSWRYTIGVGPQASPEEIQIVRDIVEYLDKHPQMVVNAAEGVIEEAMKPLEQAAQRQREQVLSPSFFVQVLSEIEWHGLATGASPEHANFRQILAWFEDAYDKMSDIEKYTMFKHYLIPASERRYRLFGPQNQVDTPEHGGGPRNFKDQVSTEMQNLGAPHAGRRYTARQNEGVEEQILRIEELLNESDPTYDLRIYSMTIGANVSNKLGGTEAETAAEIRGINGVTTVRPVPANKRRLTPHSEYIPFEIKFELVGALSRVNYRDAVLFPGLRRIKGLEIVDWTPMHRINRKGSIRQVREAQKKQLVKVLMEDAYGGSMGGLGGNMAAATMQTPSPTRPTPTPTIDDLIADWAEGGVQLYDAPTDTTNMAYHVMMPVSELWQYASTYYRGDKPMFDGQYQAFIKDGATAPVYLAVGKNGLAKITGNEDIVWYAKKAGLQEVPVFISYQRQV